MNDYNLKVKLYVENEDDKFMGIGVLWLLQGVAKCGSLRAAAIDLGISYSKAFKMVENLEKALGHEVLSRRRGGASRIGASITPYGLAFMNLYDDFQKECKAMLKTPFDEFCENLKKIEEL